jgi:ATP-dependent RNA helicase RhlE
MTFAQLELIKPLLDALTKKGYESPSPIQEKAIPPILLGKDIFGCRSEERRVGKECH